VKTTDPRYAALNAAVNEVVRNPIVARSVAYGLQLHHLEKP
jgi:hypothetical protein